MHDLVRQATLAHSSHDTQCWRFQIAEKSISIAPDFARRCPVVGPEDHHLFVSLGCAAQNMVHPALATGLHADPPLHPAGDGGIHVEVEPTQRRVSPCFRRLPSVNVLAATMTANRFYRPSCASWRRLPLGTASACGC